MTMDNENKNVFDENTPAEPIIPEPAAESAEPIAQPAAEPIAQPTAEPIAPEAEPAMQSETEHFSQSEQTSSSMPPYGGYIAPQPQPTAPQYSYYQQPSSVKADSSKRGLRIFCLLLAVVVLITCGVGIGYLAGNGNDLLRDSGSNDLSLYGDVEIQQGTLPSREGITPDENGKYTADEVAKLVSDSVVNITVYSESGTTGSVASGVIMDTNGYILSNDHIYSEIAAAKFVITLNNGESYPATYVAGDSRSDLCVLKMQAVSGLVPAVFADSSQLLAGDEVIAIGSPYGLSGTVTKGIVSSPNRRISYTSKDSTGASVKYSMQVIQTDTALNSGNSGGALVNMYGQVVGISSSKIVLSGYEGLCFAIPSNNAVKYAESLIENKAVKGRAKLGITYNEITSASSVISNLPAGLKIQEIDLNSNLYSSGLTAGDIITQIEDQDITTADVALDIIDSKTVGDSVKLKVYIAATQKYKTVTATLIEDNSVSSYSTEQQTTTSSYFNYFGN